MSKLDSDSVVRQLFFRFEEPFVRDFCRDMWHIVSDVLPYLEENGSDAAVDRCFNREDFIASQRTELIELSTQFSADPAEMPLWLRRIDRVAFAQHCIFVELVKILDEHRKHSDTAEE